jgi:hypothetical protein
MTFNQKKFEREIEKLFFLLEKILSGYSGIDITDLVFQSKIIEAMYYERQKFLIKYYSESKVIKNGLYGTSDLGFI